MPGNLRKKGGTGKTERDYLRARKRVLRQSQICAHPYCRKAIDLNLKPICQFVDTSRYTIETAHLIPLVCGPDCREQKHARKANPWSASANHKIPVSQLLPDSNMLASAKNLEPMHLKCNQSLGDGDVKPRNKTSRDWFA
ncbi:HNH endonuclease [Mycobacterium phage Chaser]|nr:HNH endonuclease [Mycobacterium phage Chaser]